MTHQDVSGQCAKLVLYKILYTKPGEERVITTDEELVNRAVSMTEFGAVKIAEYMSQHPDCAETLDRKCVTVLVEVLQRLPKTGE